jgi:hypothetical protein
MTLLSTPFIWHHTPSPIIIFVTSQEFVVIAVVNRSVFLATLQKQSSDPADWSVQSHDNLSAVCKHPEKHCTRQPTQPTQTKAYKMAWSLRSIITIYTLQDWRYHVYAVVIFHTGLHPCAMERRLRNTQDTL